MKFTPTAITDVILIEPDVFGDERGFFIETYHAKRFATAGIRTTFVQDNHSRSREGILRGLHYQIHQPQGKLVRVVSGEVFDVAVDLRQVSPTFGKWVGHYLSADNKLQLWIPPGFAHGFYVLSEWADVVYKVTDFYARQWERTLLWNDPDLGIAWPLLSGILPVLSAKDIEGKRLVDAETYDWLNFSNS
ncbi:MAG TPA: dTDP-4-dehydrorhamnose 3,5-epimerase [Anaerolineales bacterium]|nr:dTDP-4-dehydrorhamnose 3,5-epimerase [Anaerolineales bacterium]